MLALDSPEYWIIIWITIELGILTFVIRANTTKQIKSQTLSALGLSLVVIGTVFYLMFTVAIFTLDEFGTICLFSIISIQPIDEDKLLGCYTETIDLKWQYFTMTIILAMVVVIGNVIQALSKNK